MNDVTENAGGAPGPDVCGEAGIDAEMLREAERVIAAQRGAYGEAASSLDCLDSAESEGGRSEPYERGGIITARGTGEGLVLRLDGRVAAEALKTAISDFMKARRTFLGGQALSLEWVAAQPDDVLAQEIEAFLERDFEVSVKESRMYERPPQIAPVGKPSADPGLGRMKVRAARPVMPAVEKERFGGFNLERAPSLFDGMHALAQDLDTEGPLAAKTSFGSRDAAALFDDPDCRIIYATLRSGQRVESEHSLVIFGDVNSGAEVISGGDIIVLGTLRGVAHAGAYEETGGGRIIFALNFQPTQLRIGSTISRGLPECRHGPEIARVDGTLIVAESYQARSMNWGRGRQ